MSKLNIFEAPKIIGGHTRVMRYMFLHVGYNSSRIIDNEILPKMGIKVSQSELNRHLLEALK